MKLKNSFFYTLRDDPKEEDSLSGKLLVRAGFVKKSSSGVYYLLPLGFKTLKNIENIIREEMNNTGASELLMPALLPEAVYVASGRRDNFGSDMFSLKDRKGRPYVLGPTHEELFVNAAKMKIKSYKDMPFNIYQIQSKFRDEPRPRFGLIRTRQFTMKDAYSFDKDEKGLNESYDKMFEAYKKIFNRVGLDYKVVTADTGVMGGLLSEEFQALCDTGEDTLVLCDTCDFSSNIEVCPSVSTFSEVKEEKKDKELLNTPNIGTIDDLINLGFDLDKLTKSLIYKADDSYFVLCVVKANREVNEVKVKKYLNAKSIELAEPEDVEKLTNAKVGFAGPINLNLKTLVDPEVTLMKNFLVGANKTDYHYINVNISDFDPFDIIDIKNVTEEDLCPKCGGKLSFKKGIEVGNTFKLGDKYSRVMNLVYSDENNNDKYPYMGCYGIGLERIMASLVEQKHDENGIIWPIEVAPFKVSIVLLNDEVDFANKLYTDLENEGISTLLDDRDERAGVKFKDMDLIGIPIRITIGKKYNDGLVELKLRDKKEIEEVKIDDILTRIKELL